MVVADDSTDADGMMSVNLLRQVKDAETEVDSVHNKSVNEAELQRKLYLKTAANICGS